MKISQIKAAMDGVYSDLDTQATPSVTSGNFKSKLQHLFARMQNWFAISAIKIKWWVTKEPGQLPILRSFYNSLPKRKTDRDLTNEELRNLLVRFYFIEEVNEHLLQFQDLRKAIEVAVGNVELLREYHHSRRLTQSVFNSIINTPLVKKVKLSSTSEMQTLMPAEKRNPPQEKSVASKIIYPRVPKVREQTSDAILTSNVDSSLRFKN
jgi:hypothetical protein